VTIRAIACLNEVEDGAFWTSYNLEATPSSVTLFAILLKSQPPTLLLFLTCKPKTIYPTPLHANHVTSLGRVSAMHAQIQGLESKCQVGELLGTGAFGEVYKVIYGEDGKVRIFA
jgi:hypothetical protein